MLADSNVRIGGFCTIELYEVDGMLDLHVRELNLPIFSACICCSA